MAELKISPFRRTRELKSQIDEMLDTVSEAALAYKHGIKEYIKRGWDESVDEKCEQVDRCESRGDTLRTTIGQSMYTEMLLPDTSGDVLGLLGSLDHLLDDMEHTLFVIRIEQPEIPPEYHDDWIECAGHAADAVEAVVLAARSYFRDPIAARDHIHKVHFYETAFAAQHTFKDLWRVINLWCNLPPFRLHRFDQRYDIIGFGTRILSSQE